MSQYTYPIPESPHPDWSRFLAALWAHGQHNPDPEQVQKHLNNVKLLENIAQTTEQRNEPAAVRPSSLLSCQRQPYLLLKGHEPEPMSRGLAPSFAIGHLIEAMTRAYLFSALPDCFELLYDRPVPLPEWWPQHPRFRQQGTNDFTVQVRPGREEECAKYTQTGAPVCMFDMKTMGQIPFTTLSKCKSMSEKPDGFGYNAQLTVYGAGNGAACETVLMGMNRNSPMQGVAVRRLSLTERAEEEYRIRTGLEKSIEGVDPGLEFAERWGKQGEFYCNQYCSLRGPCASTPVEVMAV